MSIEAETLWQNRRDPYNMYYRVYSPVAVSVVATDGTVDILGKFVHEILAEGVVFSGDNTASINHSPMMVKTIKAIGQFFSVTGAPITPKLRYNAATGQITASEKCYGLACVAYDAEYYRLGYNYRYEYQYVYGVPRGITYYTGTILAFSADKKMVVSLDVPPVDLTQPPPDEDKYEVYRVVSYVQVTDTDVYERNKDWPAASFVPKDYAGFTTDIKRTHAVMYITPTGASNLVKYNIQLALPFVGGYDPAGVYPVLKYETASPSSLPTELWAAAKAIMDRDIPN